MRQKNLELFNLAQRHQHIRPLRYGLYSGTSFYDCKIIAKEAKQTIKLDIDPRTLSRFLYRAEKYTQRGLRSGKYLKGTYRGKQLYEQTCRVFGNVNGKWGFNSLGEKIRRLVLAGEPLEHHQRDLGRKHHLPYEIIKDEWSKAEKPLEGLTLEQIEALRKLESLWDLIPSKRQKQRTARKGDITRAEYKRKFGDYPSP